MKNQFSLPKCHEPCFMKKFSKSFFSFLTCLVFLDWGPFWAHIREIDSMNYHLNLAQKEGVKTLLHFHWKVFHFSSFTLKSFALFASSNYRISFFFSYHIYFIGFIMVARKNYVVLPFLLLFL